MATYAVGDIHGCLKPLKVLFDALKVAPDDQVVFLGDYVDRGLDSKGVLDWLIKHRKRYQFEFILGNHEIMMQTARLDQSRLPVWLPFGGAATLDSYGIGDDANWAEMINPEHWAFIDQCKPYVEKNEFIFVHAGLEAGKKLSEQSRHTLFWQKFETPQAYASNRKVICGHTSRKNGEVAHFGHTTCIDTYAYGGQWLTGLNVDSQEYIKVNLEGVAVRGELREINTAP